MSFAYEKESTSPYFVIADLIFKNDVAYYEEHFGKYFHIERKENVSYNVRLAIEIDSETRSKKLLQSLT